MVWWKVNFPINISVLGNKKIQSKGPSLQCGLTCNQGETRLKL
jgi:hypothetical protein